ncbi:MAG: PIG-L deacetylase family protein [Acidimicrobiales bacterium]
MAAPLEPLPDDWDRCLAVVAHPDDIEYGISMAVARWTGEGKQVGYVLATSGEAGIDGVPPDEAGPLREVEQRNAAALVGVDHVEFLGLADGVIEYGLALRRLLAGVIRRHRPDIIVTINHGLTFGGGAGDAVLNMADHRHLGLAVLDAARDAGNRWVFTDLIAEGLEPWDGVRWVAVSATGTPTHAVDVTGHLDTGVASLQAHRAYLDGLGEEIDTRAMLEGFARSGGEGLGTELAIAFELVRV